MVKLSFVFFVLEKKEPRKFLFAKINPLRLSSRLVPKQEKILVLSVCFAVLSNKLTRFTFFSITFTAI